MAPTIAPSEAPSDRGPTPSPTHTDNILFVDKAGSDLNGCCGNKTSPCQHIEHAYNLFLGNNGCDLKGHDGNGIFNLGNGEWYWPVDLKYDDEQIIINGNGINNTFLYYNDLTGIGCKWKKCWLEINNLTVVANNTNDMASGKQIHIHQGGTLKFHSVLFDGNLNKYPSWEIEDNVNVVCHSCIFVNNHNVSYTIRHGARVQFIDCYFQDNINQEGSLIIVNNSYVSIENSIFHSNQALFLMESSDRFQFGSFNCSVSPGLASILKFNTFSNNKVNSLVAQESSLTYLQNNTYSGNYCDGYCIASTNGVLSISNDEGFDVNFIGFNSDFSSKSTLCLSGYESRFVSPYLSFGNETNINNTKVIFKDCTYPFSFTFPNISVPKFSMSEQYYLNSEAGGSVLELFVCHNNVSTCAINCNNSVSCFSSIFSVHSPITTINCGSIFACGYGVINASNELSTMESLHMICDQRAACVQTQINAESLHEFVLECIEQESCSQMTVNIRNVSNASITCYQLSGFRFSDSLSFRDIY